MPHPTTALRRVPVQERSARRVASMLDACAEILDESGYEGLSTTLVAERAGVAIGSVYQFFPDKRALALALSQRNLETFLGRVDAIFAADRFEDWQHAVSGILDVYVDMRRSVPGFNAVAFGDQIGARLLDPEQDNGLAIAEQLSDRLVGMFGLEPGPELPFVLANAVEIGDAMFALAFRRDPAGHRETIEEAAWLILTYLERHLPG